MESEDKVISELIASGAIGAAFGALLSKNKEEGALTGAILGAFIYGTLKASEQAKKLNAPVIVEENGSLYEIDNQGLKRFVKTLNKHNKKLPNNFKLK
ncbi:MAG: hypothetical protein V9F05_05965 [Chitinophagaceae bacterium]